MDCSLPGSSVHGIFKARVLEWVAISFSRGSSRPRDRTWVSNIADRCFTIWATRKPKLNTSKAVVGFTPNIGPCPAFHSEWGTGHLAACYSCRISGPMLDLWSQYLHFHKFPWNLRSTNFFSNWIQGLSAVFLKFQGIYFIKCGASHYASNSP